MPAGGTTTAAIVRFVLGAFGFVLPNVSYLMLCVIALGLEEYALATFCGTGLVQSSTVFVWLLGSFADRFPPFVAGALAPGVLLTCIFA